jgi:hypothetical protein
VLFYVGRNEKSVSLSVRRHMRIVWAGASVPIGEGRESLHQISPASFLTNLMNKKYPE